MLMFRSRRNALVKRLWKARLGGSDEEGREVRKWLLRRLAEDQLEILNTAIETRGGGCTECVLIDKVEECCFTQPQLLCCQVWRWPDLDSVKQLKKLPMCKSDIGSVCCNPYHWSRLCQPESPPPPYSRFTNERLRPEDRAPSESSQLELRGSLSTSGEEENMEENNQWCRLAYWELSSRIGRQYPVESPSVNVFWSTPHGDGLCLATLAMHSFSPPNIVRRTREKIGEGITLSREDDGIWAYNRSDCPMFVNSPALDDQDSRVMLVYRIPPGHCLNIFSEAARARIPFGGTLSRPHVGPIDPNSVRISFVKGWGPKYSRQEVTSCPTWLEVLLAPCR